MKTVNEDPILSIRLAICEGMRSVMRDQDKEFVDAIIDALPDFFRQPLQAVKPVDQIPSVAESASRLRTVDSYGFEWANLLQDKDTDPQMLRDVVAVVREYLRIIE